MAPDIQTQVKKTLPDAIAVAQEYHEQARDAVSSKEAKIKSIEEAVQRHNSTAGSYATTHMASLAHLEPDRRTLDEIWKDYYWCYKSENYGKLNFNKVRKIVAEIQHALQLESHRDPSCAAKVRDASSALSVLSKIQHLGTRPQVSQWNVLETIVSAVKFELKF